MSFEFCIDPGHEVSVEEALGREIFHELMHLQVRFVMAVERIPELVCHEQLSAKVLDEFLFKAFHCWSTLELLQQLYSLQVFQVG